MRTAEPLRVRLQSDTVRGRGASNASSLDTCAQSRWRKVSVLGGAATRDDGRRATGALSQVADPTATRDSRRCVTGGAPPAADEGTDGADVATGGDAQFGVRSEAPDGAEATRSAACELKRGARRWGGKTGLAHGHSPTGLYGRHCPRAGARGAKGETPPTGGTPRGAGRTRGGVQRVWGVRCARCAEWGNRRRARAARAPLR